MDGVHRQPQQRLAVSWSCCAVLCFFFVFFSFLFFVHFHQNIVSLPTVMRGNRKDDLVEVHYQGEGDK